MSKIKYNDGIGALAFSEQDGITVANFSKINGIDNFWPSFSGDEFNGTNGDPPDTDVWLFKDTSTTEATIQGNELQMVCGPNETCYYHSLFQINGDFSIQVDFDISSQTTFSGVRLYVSSATSAATEGCYVEAAYDVGAKFRSDIKHDSVWAGITTTLKQNTTGGLRIIRSSSTITAYYSDGGGGYASLKSGTIGTGDFYVWLMGPTSVGGSESIKFDDFTINSGTIVYPL